MSRKARIKQVLQEREPLSERVKQVDRSISHLSSQLDAIKVACRRASTLTAVRKKSTLQAVENKCNQLLDKIAEYVERARPLRTRLERRTINIGAIGAIGAGKSSLLQAITGLDGTVIPATHGTGSFTSTKSIIVHHDDAEMAEVTFYSEKELLSEVLQPFLMKLSATQQVTISSLDEFLSLPLPSSVSDGERPTLLELKKYQDSERVEKYRPLLNGPLKRLDRVADVSQFLTYWTPVSTKPESTSSTAVKPLSEQSAWMATRQVTIRCRFRADDVGEIALIDMPGFGDKQAGNEERLVRALEEDVDLALYVYRPAPHRDGWEKSGAPQHFQVAKRALNGQLPFNEWSYVLLNHLQNKDPRQDTFEICREMAEKMYDAGVNAISALICDVTNHRDVRERVLDPILDYLAENIAKMDLHLARELQADANKLQQVLSSGVEELCQLCNSVFDDTDESELLAKKSTELWELLKESLVTKLYHSVWPNRENDDSEYISLVDRCINLAAEKKTDSAALRRLALDGSTRQAALHLLHDIRLSVVSSLQPVYSAPFAAVVNLKNQISQILCEAGGFGRLGRVASASDKLAEISLVLRRLKGCQRLAMAVDLVREFDTSSGVLLPVIRSHLAQLDPEFASSQELLSILGVEGGPVAADRLDKTVVALDQMRKSVVDTIGSALREKRKLPSQTAAYLLFEFVDRAIRDNSVLREWERCHSQLRQELWPQEFIGLAEAKVVEQAIEVALGAFEFECTPVHFRFAIS